MVGVQRGRSTSRRECTNAMQHLGSPRSTQIENLPLRLLHDFVWQLTTQAYNTLISISFLALTARPTSEEATAPKKAPPGSASGVAPPGSDSGAAESKAEDNSCNVSTNEATETTALEKMLPGSASSFSEKGIARLCQRRW